MLIGGRGDESQRQRELLKKQIYREMLDNQILSNQKYRQQLESRQKNSSSPPSNSHPHVVPISHQGSSPPQTGHQWSAGKGVVLPALKDRNTKCEGSSRFVAVRGKDKYQPRLRVRTEPPVEPPSSQEQYFSRCQDIIKELQNINGRGAPRHHRRSNRKPYGLEQSSLVPRSNHRHSHSLHYTQSEPRPIVPTATGSGRTKISTGQQARIPSFITSGSAEKGQQSEGQVPVKGTALTNFVNSNSIQSKPKAAKQKESSAQLTHVDSQNEFVFDMTEMKNYNKKNLATSPPVQSTTDFKGQKSKVSHRYEQNATQKRPSKFKKSGNVPKAPSRHESGTISSLGRPKSKLSETQPCQRPAAAGTSVEINPLKQHSEGIGEENTQTVGAKPLQREAFLSVLRKLKDRGENLIQKISKNKLEEG